MGAKIFAVVHRSAGAPALDVDDASDPSLKDGGRLMSRYALGDGDQPLGTVSFYEADQLSSANAAADTDEVFPIREDCVAKLLADGVRELAASVRDSDQINKGRLEPPWPGAKISAGIVLIDERGWVTIREPKGHFGGYNWTYAKGRLDPGETQEETAHRELFEETGLRARIVGLVGDFKGDTGVTRLYVGVRTSGVETPSDETERIRTVSPFTALELLNRQRDRDMLWRLVEIAASTVTWTWPIDGERWTCRVVDGRIRRVPGGAKAA